MRIATMKKCNFFEKCKFPTKKGFRVIWRTFLNIHFPNVNSKKPQYRWNKSPKYNNICGKSTLFYQFIQNVFLSSIDKYHIEFNIFMKHLYPVSLKVSMWYVHQNCIVFMSGVFSWIFPHYIETILKIFISYTATKNRSDTENNIFAYNAG